MLAVSVALAFQLVSVPMGTDERGKESVREREREGETERQRERENRTQKYKEFH